MRPIHYWLISFLSVATQNMFACCWFFPFFSHFLCMKDLQGKIKCARSSANCQLVLIHNTHRRHRNNKWKRTSNHKPSQLHILASVERTEHEPGTEYKWVIRNGANTQTEKKHNKRAFKRVHVSRGFFSVSLLFRFLFQIVRNFSDAFVKW